MEPGAGSDRIAALAAHTVPTPAQLAALTDGYIAFVHFGPNTFTRREWGTGKEDPAVFTPLDSTPTSGSRLCAMQV